MGVKLANEERHSEFFKNHPNYTQSTEKRRKRQRNVGEHHCKPSKRPTNINLVSKRQPGEGLSHLSPRALFALIS